MKQSTKVLNQLKTKVYFILLECPETRKDDFLLIKEFKNRYYKEFTFNDIFNNHNDICFPSFESITRARRKIQSEHSDLIHYETLSLRLEQTKEYKGFSLS